MNLGQSRCAERHRIKVRDSHHWGPYGVLTRDVAFKAQEVGNHDYFRAPEIVEDICGCFEDGFGVNLLDRFVRSTKPCVVKFIDKETRSDCLPAAVYYLYTVWRGDKLSDQCSTCFNGKASPIPRDRILRVEFGDQPI